MEGLQPRQGPGRPVVFACIALCTSSLLKYVSTSLSTQGSYSPAASVHASCLEGELVPAEYTCCLTADYSLSYLTACMGSKLQTWHFNVERWATKLHCWPCEEENSA